MVVIQAYLTVVVNDTVLHPYIIYCKVTWLNLAMMILVNKKQHILMVLL